MLITPPWKTSFESRTDLSVYGDNALGLFALALKFRIDDLVSVAADSITDGSQDKKCDIVYVNRDDGFALIAQCYFSSKDKPSAPSNKASDLNTAMSWILERPLAGLPTPLVAAAQDVRDAIDSGDIVNLYVWYIHNLPESENVRQELGAVESTASLYLRNCFPTQKIDVEVLEVGTGRFAEWYADTQSPILVNDTFIIPIRNGFEVKGPKWRSFVTTVPVRFLYREYKNHGKKLFSANVRDYLGSRASESNINNGIKKTVENEPANFWTYNNGLTVLVNSFENKKHNGKNVLEVVGLSIVNGAQTTGAIGSLKKLPPEDALVSIRFVQTEDADIIHDTIRFNNSQNSITASDFRSTDNIQRRLRDEIAKIPDAEYEGGRRGGSGDAIRRRANLLPSYTVGQALAAVNGDPVNAYNQKLKIWADDTLYSKYFKEETHGTHVVFAYGLLRAIEARKLHLMEILKAGTTLTSDEDMQLSYFSRRGSTYLLTSAIAHCIETFMGKPVSNVSRLSFGDKVSPKRAQSIWAEIVNVNAPAVSQLLTAFSEGLTSPNNARDAIKTFKTMIDITKTSNQKTYKEFAKRVIVD